MKIRLAFIGCAFVGLAAAGVAAQQGPPNDPIRELLVEVRALRQAMERQASVGARVQLTVARIQLQEQRIAELSRQVGNVRGQLRNIESEQATMQPLLQQLLDPTRVVPPEQREEFEQQIALMKGQLSSIERRRQDLVQEESFLSQQLSTEQGRWSAINDQLDALERALTTSQR